MGKRKTVQEKADKLYSFIREYVKEHARRPNQRAMYQAIGVSPNTLQDVLDLLVAQGRAIHHMGNHRHRPRQFWLIGGDDVAD